MLKSNRHLILFLLGTVFFIGISSLTKAQSRPELWLQITDSISFGNIGAVSVDRQQQILVCNTLGEVSRYDSNGKLQFVYSPKRPAQIQVLEAWNSLRIFMFSRELQEYTFLDRFLTDNPYNRISPELITYARLIAPAQDDNLWVLDDADLSLKKINPIQNEVILNTQLALVLPSGNGDFTFMREYQNQVFIANPKQGIHIFDNMGNFKKTIPALGTDWFGFAGENIIYINQEKLIMANLYGPQVQTCALPNGIKALYVLKAGQIFWFFNEKKGYKGVWRK